MEKSRLNPFELKELLKWVDSFALSRSSKRLCRDFADGVLLAEILKFEFPKLVDLHNYTSCNSINGKMRNWDTLNRKVLKKLHVHLKLEEMEKLSKAETNFIEEVLFSIMNKVKIVKAEEAAKSADTVSKSTDIMTVTVARQVGDHVEHVPQQMIQLAIHEELLDKYNAQQSLVHELQEKIGVLQGAIQSKMQIIRDLEERLEAKKNKNITISSIKDSLANLF